MTITSLRNAAHRFDPSSAPLDRMPSTLTGPGANTRRRFTAAVVAREVLRDAVMILGERGIPVMPLKGVLFQQILYTDPADRGLCDVDVLVPERRFAEAIGLLLDRGFRPWSAGPSWIEAALLSPRGLPLDLHRRIFCAWRYRISTDDLFRRASLDTELIGAPLWIMHPEDTLAHLIGKFVSDHVHAEAAPRLHEIARVAAHYALEPASVARHLTSCGLARAARHVLAHGVRELGEPFFEATLRQLPKDRRGELVVQVAERLARRLDRTALAPLSAHLLNTTLPRGAASLGMAALYAARHAQLERAQGAGGGHWAPFFSASSSSARRKASSARRSR
jgi:Uncharacterised nucleotidyltransferase